MKFFLFLRIALLFVLILFFNLWGIQKERKVDFSLNQQFTLSKDTQEYLKNISQEKKKVKILALFHKKSQYYSKISFLLQSYKHLSQGAIEIHFLNPLHHPIQAREISQKYGIKITENLLIIDANLGEEIQKEFVRFIKESQLSVVKKQKDKFFIIGHRGEDLLASAIYATLQGKKKNTYLVKKGERNSQILGEILKQKNANLYLLNLQEKEIPKETDALFILNPEYDLSEVEAQKISEYLERGGNLLISLREKNNHIHLFQLLNSYGIFPHSDTVSSRKEKAVNLIAKFSHSLPFESPLEGEITFLPFGFCSIEMLQEDSEITLFPLIETHQSYSEENQDISEEKNTPLYLATAAMIKRGNKSSKVLVFGSNTFFEKGIFDKKQDKFIQLSLNWILNKEKTLGIPAHRFLKFPLALTEKELSLFHLFSLFLLPFLCFLLGLFFQKIRNS